MNPHAAIIQAFDRYVAEARTRMAPDKRTKDDATSADLDAGGRTPPSLLFDGKKPTKRKPAKKGVWASWTGAHAARRIDPTRKARAQKADFQGIPIEIDRPKSFVQEGTDAQGNAWRRLYRYDYGFIPKTEGGDGEGIDVFMGPCDDAPMSWWAIQTTDDGSFDEFKVCLGFSSPALAQACYRMHIPAQYCAGWFPVPVPFIRSLLGLEPRGVIKALTRKAITR